ncbi:hypothetical protein PF005_g25273 [Phytophthora fragariae]|uniref:Secreted protein n=1 Tax=Phytophthora fragariae TaxID=53985 RepID=A0A6A3DUE8_9STRA|nr:hypothetical protein PF009_g26000 [Phytophthora fragariae]KAE9062260.1 hypothetical protein PF010_g29478 [Phytophthora fragariae]KAE9175724.1 hypothetical protein PF005_g25273 [Phytophthora fragariae]KAE9180587.1 hypothetical protein PF004_g24795 [Phytophthora fragariae]KAE9188140.1 hypothetical protein PF002_g25392 [Phytophthora fragariae]
MAWTHTSGRVWRVLPSLSVSYMCMCACSYGTRPCPCVPGCLVVRGHRPAPSLQSGSPVLVTRAPRAS